jgi:basic amino acid/polyamine antiporter, APA family
MNKTEPIIATARKPPQTSGLVRGLGGWAAAAIVVGTMIGTGVFIVPADMARSAGSVMLVMLAWIVGGALTLFGALSAAELGAALPEAGGTYAYLNRAYGAPWAFLFGWIYCVLGAPTSIATIAAGLMRFVGFLFPFAATPIFAWHVTLPWTTHPHTVTLIWAQPLAVAAIGAVTFVNDLGVRLGGEVQVALTVVKIAAIIAVIAAGLFFGHGTTANFHFSALAGTTAVGLSGFLTAMAGALWAYDGWVNLTFVGSEIRNPERNIPLSLFGGVALVCGLYVAMSAACFYVLPFSKVAASSLVASDVVARATGHSAASWLTLATITCALGTLNSSILTNARVDYAMARDGLFFRIARGVDPRFHTPSRALVFQAVLASILALSGTFEDLYSLYVFTVWIFYGLQTAAVIRLRMKEPNLARPYRTLGYPVLPILFVIGAVAVTVNSWLQRPISSSIGLGLMAFGFLFYRHWRGQAKQSGAFAPADYDS